MLKQDFSIWGWLNDRAQEFASPSWEIITFPVKEQCYAIKVDTNMTTLEQVLPDEYIRDEITIVETSEHWNISMPVFSQREPLFTWVLKPHHEVSFEQASFIKGQLAMLVNAEAQNFESYPTFVPYFFPFDDMVFEMNKSLETRKKTFFLNGQSGTGKQTFIRNHLLLNYQYSLDLPLQQDRVSYIEFQGTENVKIVIVPELALCEEEELNSIAEMIEKDSITHVYLCSSYDPEILHSRAIISSYICKISLENRIIFPALHRRPKSAANAMKYYFRAKGISLPDVMNDAWFMKNILKEGFHDITHGLANALRPGQSIAEWLQNGKHLRDIVATIEYNAIKFAQRVVGNSQLKIAKMLGISRGSLQHKLKKYDFPYHEWEE